MRPGIAFAVPLFNGATGGISFGVSGYGGAPPGAPTYIPNNVTGLNDILSSPGGTFLTANPIVANNINSSGLVGLPWYQFQIGGGNVNGAFGAGEVLLTGTNVGFNLQDPVAGSGSASYAVASSISSFVNPVAYNGPFGTFLAIKGTLPAVNAAGVAAIRTHITSANPASPFFGGGLGIDLPQLVLANGRLAGNLYTFVALGGTGAAMLVDNAALGTFRGLAINNLNFNIPAGDAFTAVSTLTVYADPMSMEMIDPTALDNADLVAAAGGGLPSTTVLGYTAVPEPSSWLLASSAVALLAYRKRKVF
jgi:hypothetical protein